MSLQESEEVKQYRQRLKDAKKYYTNQIDMLEKRYGYFPKTFRWQGKIYKVDSIKQCWNKPTALYFKVHCQNQVFVLRQSIRLNVWTIRDDD